MSKPLVRHKYWRERTTWFVSVYMGTQVVFAYSSRDKRRIRRALRRAGWIK